MTDRELKKLSRSELLEILIEQSRELKAVRAELDEAKSELANRKIVMDNAGSIAEASLQLSGIFQDAQEACRQYTDSIRDLSERQEKICARLESESQAKADRILADALEQSARIRNRCEEQCRTMTAEAKASSQAYWDEVSDRLSAFCTDHAELCRLLQIDAKNIKTPSYE